MESYGLGMDDLFDDGDVAQELNEFETVEETNADSSQQGDGAADNTLNGSQTNCFSTFKTWLNRVCKMSGVYER